MIGFTLTEDQISLRTVLRLSSATRCPFEKDPRNTDHGPTDELRVELNKLARETRRFCTAITRKMGQPGLNHVGTAIALKQPGTRHWVLLPHCNAPDEGNMNLLVEVASEEQQEKWLRPLTEGLHRSCFAMTEPGRAGADPTLRTTAIQTATTLSLTAESGL